MVSEETFLMQQLTGIERIGNIHKRQQVDRIAVRGLYTNDREVINQELEAKIPTVMGNNGFVLHSDHSIPSEVDNENYAYFIQRGLELGTY